MLRSLYIKDYALIEELEVEFEHGLNIITGETGAGKSILVGALSMILGDRASTDTVRKGAKKAIIEGIFDDADTPEIDELLREYAIEPMPRVILRRQITSTQSRAFINDTPATLDVIRNVAAELIDLHGQHEHQSLLQREKHRHLLDSFGGFGESVEEYSDAYEHVRNLLEEREQLQKRRAELAQQQELFAFQLKEIDEVNPQPDEDKDLEREKKVLANAEQLHDSSSKLYDMLFEGNQAIYDRLVIAKNELEDLAHIDDAFDEMLEELKSAQISVSETASFLQDYSANISFDPDRLAAVRGRLAELDRLKRKYGGTLSSVLSHREKISRQHNLAKDFEGALHDLDERIGEAQQRLSESAHELSNKRQSVAERIEEAIVDELAGLGMPDSRFQVRFSRTPDPDGWIIAKSDDGTCYTAHEHGMDLVEFYLSTNIGESLKPLRKVASGGEISRIMLALKTILAKSERLPILVFDEIDTGISGSMARRVGEGMYELAAFHQIVAITHLPQIAALADVHFKVEKFVEEERTKTSMRKLSPSDHTSQVARLISGEQVTKAALENAKELMDVQNE